MMIPFKSAIHIPAREMTEESSRINKEFQARRTVRDFSTQPIPEGVLEECIAAAGSAPSGANKQPWHFVVVQNPKVKKELRAAAEEEEKAFYNGRASKEWLRDLEVFETNEIKQFLEDAPALIAIFLKSYEEDSSGSKHHTYYAKESVGIATGFLISALHRCGLQTLTHTPSPMKFLNKLLGRPDNEKPFLLLVVGFAAENAGIPDITRKKLAEISTFI